MSLYAVIELNNGKHYSIKPFPNEQTDALELCHQVEKASIKSFKVAWSNKE